MAVNIARWIAAGFNRMHYAILDGAGIAIGTSTSLAAGSDSAAGRLFNVNTANVSIPAARTVPVEGDDGIAGSFIFPFAEVVTFDIESGEFDQTFRALAESTTNQALGDITWSPVAPKDPAYRQMSLNLIGRAQSQSSGSVGVEGYMNILIPKAVVVPIHTGGLGNAAAQSNRYNVTVQLSDIYPWGSAITNALNGTTAAHMFDGYSEYPVTFHSFTGNNAITTVTLAQTPAEASSDKVRVYVNGTALTYTTDYTVDVATRVVTFVAAPAAAAKVVIVYEYTD